VSYSTVEHCHQWHSTTKLVYEGGYALALGIHDLSSFTAEHFLHTECAVTAESVGGCVIIHAVTVPRDSAANISSIMNLLTVAALVENITAANASLESSEVQLPSDDDITLGAVVESAHEPHAVAPTRWIDDGSLSVAEAEEIILFGGFGLHLGPGQDAVKVCETISIA